MVEAFDPEAYRAAERAGYEAVAADYDRWLASATARFAEPLLTFLDPRPGERVLDAATGPGVLVPGILRRVGPGGACVGVDFSDAMIRIARAGAADLPGARFEVMDVERLGFPDAVFDRAACGFGLMHFPSASRALAELHRVLTPGGSVAVSVWSPLPRVEFMALMLTALKEVAPGAGFPPGPPMFGLGTPEALGPLLASAGFANPEFRETTVELRFPGFDAWWNALVLGAARLGGVVRELAPEAREALRARLRVLVEPRLTPEGLTLGGSALLARAFRSPDARMIA